jgi:hypothetical protein
MTRIVVVATFALVVALLAAPAQAQSIRTFVSVTGSDSNPCSITEPCRHFSAAVAATALGGEVDALEPGAYGSFTINQAITIEGQGWSYVAPGGNGIAITINATTDDNIEISGVLLNGVDVANSIGIQFTLGASLNIENCVIRNFSGSGINFTPNAFTQYQLSVSNTRVLDNGIGISVSPVGPGLGSVSVGGILDHIEMIGNETGLKVATLSGQIVDFMVSESVAANNQSGILVQTTGATSNVMVRNSTITNNVTGVEAQTSGSLVRITRSTIARNSTGWEISGGAVVSSFGDNSIIDNPSGDDAPPVNGYK